MLLPYGASTQLACFLESCPTTENNPNSKFSRLCSVAGNITRGNQQFTDSHWNNKTWSGYVSDCLDYVGPYLDRLAALPQSHLTDLPSVRGRRRDPSFSYEAMYLHEREKKLRNSYGDLLTKLFTLFLLHTCHFFLCLPTGLSWMFSLTVFSWDKLDSCKDCLLTVLA